MRINKYLAEHHGVSRRKADELIERGKVLVNGARAHLGDQVSPTDRVTVAEKLQKQFSYYAYYKPRGLITHKQHKGEKDIASEVKIPGVFPIGRLDKDSEGLILLTDNGRITDKLLNPKYEHEKEYVVSTRGAVKAHQLAVMARGMKLEGDLITKPAKTKMLGEKQFSITLSEGKKHEIRRMCDAFSLPIESLKRVRFMNIRLGSMKPGEIRKIEGKELQTLLSQSEITNKD